MQSDIGTTFKRALVTGGAGFIGSHLVEALLAAGCRVAVLDDLSSGKRSNLEAVAGRIDFYEGDIRDHDTLNRAVAGCDLVFHQAAVVSVTRTVEDPLGSSAVNATGTLQVLEAARRNQVKRVILASSSAVYGDDPQLPKHEGMTPQPLSPYAVQKLTGEHYARLYARLYGLQSVCLRYFNVFGPRQDPSSPYSGVISIFLTCAADARQPCIYGDGRQSRDFVFVQDVVQANLASATTASAQGDVFNVGTGRAIEIRELWRRIARLAGTPIEPAFAPPRAGDIVASVADIRRAGDLLGYRPAWSFADGLATTYDWYRNPNA